MTDFFVEAKYVGTQYADEFHRDSTYICRVRQLMFGRVMIVPTQGFNRREYTEWRKVYPNLYAFLSDWYITALQQPFARVQ
jgi:hypothetical protein